MSRLFLISTSTTNVKVAMKWKYRILFLLSLRKIILHIHIKLPLKNTSPVFFWNKKWWVIGLLMSWCYFVLLCCSTWARTRSFTCAMNVLYHWVISPTSLIPFSKSCVTVVLERGRLAQSGIDHLRKGLFALFLSTLTSTLSWNQIWLIGSLLWLNKILFSSQ